MIYITYCFVNQLNNNMAVKYMDDIDIIEYLKSCSDCFNHYMKCMKDEKDKSIKNTLYNHIKYYITHFKEFPCDFNFKFEPIKCENIIDENIVD